MKTIILLQTPINTVDAEAITQQEWQDVSKISVTMLPITQELAFKHHGYTEKVEKRGFYKGRNANIKLGNRIIDAGRALLIVSVMDYGKVIDFLVANPDES